MLFTLYIGIALIVFMCCIQPQKFIEENTTLKGLFKAFKHASALSVIASIIVAALWPVVVLGLLFKVKK